MYSNWLVVRVLILIIIINCSVSEILQVQILQTTSKPKGKTDVYVNGLFPFHCQKMMISRMDRKQQNACLISTFARTAFGPVSMIWLMASSIMTYFKLHKVWGMPSSTLYMMQGEINQQSIWLITFGDDSKATDLEVVRR